MAATALREEVWRGCRMRRLVVLVASGGALRGTLPTSSPPAGVAKLSPSIAWPTASLTAYMAICWGRPARAATSFLERSSCTSR